MKEKLRRFLMSMGIECDDIKEEAQTVCVLPPALYTIVVDEVGRRESLRSRVLGSKLGELSVLLEDGYKVRFNCSVICMTVTIEELGKRFVSEVVI